MLQEPYSSGLKIFFEELETANSVEEELSDAEKSLDPAATVMAEASLETLSQAIKKKASPQTARQAILSIMFFLKNINMEGLLITSNLYKKIIKRKYR